MRTCETDQNCKAFIARQQQSFKPDKPQQKLAGPEDLSKLEDALTSYADWVDCHQLGHADERPDCRLI